VLPAPDRSRPEDFARKVEAFRRAMGKPDRFILPGVCAVFDCGFSVTFERFNPGDVFRIAGIDKATSGGNGATALRTLEAEVLDCSGWMCPWCGDTRGFVVCASCLNTPVCSGRVGTHHGRRIFHCRDSCGASGEMLPLAEVTGADGIQGPGHAWGLSGQQNLLVPSSGGPLLGKPRK
jgi:hypothetical protein